MFDVSRNSTTEQERAILRKLRVWIAALAVACLLAGIGVGAMLSGRPTTAQPEIQIAHAPEALSASFAEIARRVEPAVVNIETTQAQLDVNEKDEDKEDQSPNNSLLDMFRRPRRAPTHGVGSGFIVGAKGYILTNNHVIEDASRIIVGLQSGEKYRGTVVGVDQETDVAVIKIDTPRDLPTVTLGDSNAAQVGDWVLAMGSPFGLDQTVTAGIISKKERETPFFNVFQRFLQTDAAINRGNSGGPLVNMRGEVIGMNSQIATSTGDYNGIGFALPANETSFVYKQLISQGRVKRGYLGITLESVHDEYAKVYGLADSRGAIVMSVTSVENGQTTPAAKIGLQPNDIIIDFQNAPVLNAQDLIQRVASTPVGQEVTLTFFREANGKLEKKTASVALAERPNLSPREWSPSPTVETLKNGEPRGNALRLGITLAELTPQLLADQHLTGVQGLYVKEIDPNGLIAELRTPGGQPVIGPRDIITRINRTSVTSLADFQRVLNGLKPGDPIVLNVTRIVKELKGDRQVPVIIQFTYQ